MNKWKVSRNSGFSLMEVMIVIVIVAILVSLAYPSYTQYVRKSKRGEAHQLLMNWSINQEIWRSNNTQYATLLQLPEPAHDHYNFDFAVDPTANSYTLRATGQGDQTNDTSRGGTAGDCAILTLDQSGVKVSPACWN